MKIFLSLFLLSSSKRHGVPADAPGRRGAQVEVVKEERGLRRGRRGGGARRAEKSLGVLSRLLAAADAGASAAAAAAAAPAAAAAAALLRSLRRGLERRGVRGQRVPLSLGRGELCEEARGARLALLLL